MYQRIPIATDGSELATKAVTHAVALAKDLKIPVSVVTVTEAWSALELARMARLRVQNPIAQYEEMAAAAGKNILEKAAQIAKSQGVTCELVHVRDSTRRLCEKIFRRGGSDAGAEAIGAGPKHGSACRKGRTS